jgi:SsrA-binding protein
MKIFNRKAGHNYHILETFEAGVVLTGMEVKSIREGKVDLNESFAKVSNGEVFLKNAYLYPPQGADSREYDPRHDRKLLLHKSQINSLIGKTSGAAITLIPVAIYTTRNYIKVELALAASKKKYDHKKAIKERDEKRRIDQELRGDKLDFEDSKRRG